MKTTALEVLRKQARQAKQRHDIATQYHAVVLYPRGESNPNRRNRNPIFYPLNYGDMYGARTEARLHFHCKVSSFASIIQIIIVMKKRLRVNSYGIIPVGSSMTEFNCFTAGSYEIYRAARQCHSSCKAAIEHASADISNGNIRIGNDSEHIAFNRELHTVSHCGNVN